MEFALCCEARVLMQGGTIGYSVDKESFGNEVKVAVDRVTGFVVQFDKDKDQLIADFERVTRWHHNTDILVRSSAPPASRLRIIE